MGLTETLGSPKTLNKSSVSAAVTAEIVMSTSKSVAHTLLPCQYELGWNPEPGAQ